MLDLNLKSLILSTSSAWLVNQAELELLDFLTNSRVWTLFIDLVRVLEGIKKPPLNRTSWPTPTLLSHFIFSMISHPLHLPPGLPQISILPSSLPQIYRKYILLLCRVSSLISFSNPPFTAFTSLELQKYFLYII